MADITQTAEIKEELEGAVSEGKAAQDEHQQAVATTHSAEETIAKSLAEAGKRVQESIEAAKEASEQAAAYNAEEQAASSGDIIGPMEAYALVEQQNKANKMATKATVQAFTDSVSYATSAVVETAGVVLDNADALVNGIKDGATNPGALAPYLLTVGLGSAGAVFLGNDGIQSTVINALESFTGLGGQESETEEKFVGGVTTPEEQAAWLAENGNGVPNDAYGEGKDVPGEGKDFTSTTKVTVETGVEAIDASDSELSDLADLDKVTSGEALFGDSKLGKWMDNVSKMFDTEEASPAGQLVAAIADNAAPGLTAVASTVLKTVGPNLAKLMAAKDEVDENEAQNQGQNDGPQASV